MPSLHTQAGMVASIARQAAFLPGSDRYLAGVCSAYTELPKSISITRRSPHLLPYHPKQANICAHSLLVNLGGAGTIVLDDIPLRIRPGQALLIFPQQFHYYEQLQESRLLWVYVSFESAEPSLLTPLRNRLVTLPLPSLADFRELLLFYTAADRTIPLDNGLVATQLWRMLLRLAQACATLPAKPGAAITMPPRGSAWMLTLQRAILARIRTPIGIRELAQPMGMSANNLAMKFRRETGMGLGGYIRNFRANRAAMLLHATNLSLKEIADLCGYSSIYVFCRTFKNVSGLTPSVFRRQGHASSPAAGAGRRIKTYRRC